jgi:hypothetical protein
MWAAAHECCVPVLQLCVLHETRYSGTSVGPFCSKRAENRPRQRHGLLTLPCEGPQMSRPRG